MAWENAVFGYHRDLTHQANRFFMDNAAIKADTEKKMATFDVRPPIATLQAKSFSGGNQQKIVVAREIEQNPALLLIGQPTRGVDIGAIEFIHRQLVALRDAGKAILLVSVELDEIRSLADRILVMFAGRIVGERSPQASEGEIGLLMAGTLRGTVTLALANGLYLLLLLLGGMISPIQSVATAVAWIGRRWRGIIQPTAGISCWASNN